MKIFQVPAATLGHDFVKCEEKYKFIPTDLEKLLNNTKSLLDEPYKNKNAYKIFRSFDPFSKHKPHIAKMSRNYNISNAWIKCYELIHGFHLVPVGSTSDFVHFANAELPGSFVCATHHYVNTMTDCKYKWIASSMIGAKNLDDYYKLYKNYPKRWLMDKKCDGDLTKLDVVMSLSKVAYESTSNGVDLYTSDLGFDVSDNYNDQENMHLRANIGQILCGLLSLKTGGNMITKQYTYFNPVNISIIGGLSMVFTEVFITKPLSSKQSNSEIYLVCKNMKKNKFYDQLINELTKMLQETPYKFIKEINMSAPFVSLIRKSLYCIYRDQIKKIKTDISIYESVKHHNISKASYDAAVMCSKYRKGMIRKFNSNVYIMPISYKARLHMKNIYRQ